MKDEKLNLQTEVLHDNTREKPSDYLTENKTWW